MSCSTTNAKMAVPTGHFTTSSTDDAAAATTNTATTTVGATNAGC